MEHRVSKPNRKIFEQENRKLELAIATLKEKLRSVRESEAEIIASYENLKLKREDKLEAKTNVEQIIRSMSQEINQLSNRLMQLQSKVHYRDMKKLDEAISKLKSHMDAHHLKLSEEKKIMAEIDKLNRSKKVVGEYLQVGASLKAVRNSQNEKRVLRDKLVKELANMRGHDESYREELSNVKMNESQVLLDLDALHQEKQRLQAKFSQQVEDYKKQKEETKAAKQQGKQQKALQKNLFQKQRSMSVCERKIDNDEDLEQLSPLIGQCKKLIDFCQRLSKAHQDDSKKKTQKRKPLSYSPDLLSHFMAFNVIPPMYVSEIDSCIETLQHRKSKLLEDLTIEKLQLSMPSASMVTSDSMMTVVSTNTITEEEEINMTSAPCSRGTSCDSAGSGNSAEPQAPYDGSENSSYTKQLSNRSLDDVMQTKADIILSCLQDLSLCSSSIENIS